MKQLLLVAVMVLVSLVGMVGFSRDAESQNDTPTMNEISNAVSALQARANPTTEAVTELPATVNAGDEYNPYYDPKEAVIEPPATVNAGLLAKPKMYYLTKNSFDGGDAITACDSGFHMASISEIQDPSNLQYADRSTAEYDSLVDGQRLGPPSNHMGWVRTGVYPPSGFVYDCEDFRDNRYNHSGTTVSLTEQTASTPNMLWQAALQFCSQPEPVWCVEDSERANVNPVIDTIIAHAFEFGD